MSNTTAQKKNKPLQISIPYVIYADRKLSATAKFILAEILSLFEINSLQCWASNEHFCEMFGLKKKNVSYHIQQIEKEGWIKSEAIKRCDIEDCNLRGRGWHRHIYAQLPLSNILDSLSNKLDSPIQNTGYPIKSVGTISNTLENNSKSNNKEKEINKEKEFGAVVTAPSTIQDKKYPLLEDLTENDFLEISEHYKVPLAFVKSKYEDMCLWVGEKPASKRSAGRNWRLTLMNWVKRDALKIAQGQNNRKGGVLDATNL